MAIKLIKHMENKNSSFFSKFNEIVLTDSETILICHEILRHMPGKRLVAVGTWGNKPVIAKIFYHRNALHHAKREHQGTQAMHTAGVITPAIYYFGETKDGAAKVILYEKIENAISLEEIWQTKHLYANWKSILHHMIIELATLHVLGVLQKDLHLKNFLLANSRIYTIDGGEVSIAPQPLSIKTSINNLALFFSQLGAGQELLQQELFATYIRVRGWYVKKNELVALNKAIIKWNSKREIEYRKKIIRNSTNFACQKSLKQLILYDRAIESAEWQALLKSPEEFFNLKTTSLLKAGRSATVAKFILHGKTYVIKRYNIKNAWHALRRCFRVSRAARHWQLALKLCLFGIPTPRPIAMIEKRIFGLRRKSYLIMEYVEGKPLSSFIDLPPKNIMEKVYKLISMLAELRLSHGDLKSTNIIQTENQLVVIDLDGMQQHKSSRGLQRAVKRDIERFLKNWQNNK